MGALLKTKQAAHLIGVTADCLHVWRSKGLNLEILAPKSDWVPQRTPCYDEDRVKAFAKDYHNRELRSKRVKGVLGVSEAAKILQVSGGTLYSWQRNGVWLDLRADGYDSSMPFRYSEERVRALAAFGREHYTSLRCRDIGPNELTASAASRILGVTPATVGNWYRKGKYCEIFVKDARPPRCYKDEVLKLKEMFKSDRKDYMTTDEAAECLGITLLQLRYWRLNGRYPDLLYRKSMKQGYPSLYYTNKIKELAGKIQKSRAQYFTSQQAADFLGIGASAFSRLVQKIKDKDIYAPENFITKYKLYRKDKLKELKRSRRKKKSA